MRVADLHEPESTAASERFARRLMLPRALAFCSVSLVCPLVMAASPDRAQPNFIVILGEGAGWAGSSVQMDDRLPGSRGSLTPTPNLERLAAGGMRFANGYAASPRCTPSRAALLTGRNPAGLRMTFVGDGRRSMGQGGYADTGRAVLTPVPVLELPGETTTIAEVLKGAGYATAHFGKWHVGRADPKTHGFDESDGPNNNGGPENVTNPNPKQALALTAQGIGFMERQVKEGRPFYLQMSYYPSRPERGERRSSDTETEEIKLTDQTIGEVLDAVGRLGLEKDTYIIYTADHGAIGSNVPLAGGKGSVSEGGLRVPFIIRGPGIAPGVCSRVFVTALDLLPTIADLGHAKMPEPSEGGSLAPVLADGGEGRVARGRDEFVVHFPHYDKDARGPASAIYLSGYKLIHLYESGENRLYDVSTDIGEQKNLAASDPARAADMAQRLARYLQEVGAQLPAPKSRDNPP